MLKCLWRNSNFIIKNNLSKIDLLCKIITDVLQIKDKLYFDLIITNACKMRKLNLQYRNLDYATDVLSFAFFESQSIKTSMLGEIYLNYQKIISQAKQYHHSLEREFYFLLTHGILHLLGYDHIKKEDEVIMFNLQKIILKKIKVERF